MWKEWLLMIVLLVAQFVSICTDSFLLPFFPPEARSKGLTELHIGLVFSAFEVSRFFFSLVVGYLIEKLNARTWCLVGGLLSTVTCVVFGLLSYAPDGDYLYLCILVRLVAGAGSSALVVSATSILMKATSFQPTTIAGITEIMQGAAYGGGPALGAAVYGICGYGCVFWTIGIALAVINIIQIFVVPKIEKEEITQKSALHLLKIPGILLIYLQFFVYKVIQTSCYTTISEYIIHEYKKPPTTVGLLFTIIAVVYIIACLPVTKIVNKGFVHSSLVALWCVTTIVYILIGPSPLLDFIFQGKSYIMVPGAALCLQNILEVFLYVATYPGAINLAAVNGHQKDSIQIYGAVTGLFNSALGVGAIIGPVMAGAITQSIGFRWMATIFSGVALFMLCILITYLVYMKLSGKLLKPEDMKPYTEEAKIQSGDNSESAILLSEGSQ